MKEIPLTQGKVALVDDSDFELLSQFKWCASKVTTKTNGDIWYAVRTVKRVNGRDTNISMHRFILGAPKGMVVDHRNHNGLDNRRSNIRLCTVAQNSHNIRRARRNLPRGCSLIHPNREKKYQANICVNGRSYNLGAFSDPIQAGMAYDLASMVLHGEFGIRNGLVDLSLAESEIPKLRHLLEAKQS